MPIIESKVPPQVGWFSEIGDPAALLPAPSLSDDQIADICGCPLALLSSAELNIARMIWAAAINSNQ